MSDFAILSVNTTPVPLTTTTISQDEQTVQLASRAAFLSLFILISFIGNIVLFATIIQSRSLRKVRLNLIIVSLSAVNILNCVCNMPLVLGYTVTDSWDYGDELCRVNSSLMHLLSIAMVLGIGIMALDRLLAVINPSKYETLMSQCVCNTLIVCTWVQAGAFAFPLLSTAIVSEPFKSRYLCSIKPGTTLVYPLITSIICFLIPCILILLSFAVIARYAFKEKTMHQQMSRDHRYTDVLINETREWKEIKRTRFVVSLFIFWSLLEGPYHFYTHIEQCHSSPEIQGTTETSTSLFAVDSVTLNILETSFTWMKFSYCMILPFATFFWRKNIWQKFKDLVLCRKSNLIVDGGNSGNNDNNNKTEKKRNTAFLEKNKVFKIPVLFATSRGIHVKKYDNEKGETQELSESNDSEYFFADMTSKSNDIKILRNKIKKCDVNGPDSPHNLDVDTSDYDSNDDEAPDPFSVSDPTVLKTKKNSVDYDKNVHVRSKSDTVSSQDSSILASARTPRAVVAQLDETHPPGKKERKRNSSQHDSGVDSKFNSTEKRKMKKRKNQDVTVETEETSPAAQKDDAEPRADSNDSGRGSVKEVEKKKKKRKKVSASVGAGDDETDIPSNQSSPRDGQGTNHTPRDKHSSDQSSTNQGTGDEPQPAKENSDINKSDKSVKSKTKKKRKPKSQSEVESPKQETIEIQNPVFENDIDNELARTRPPPRLKPLDHKNVRANKTSPIPPLRSSQLAEPQASSQPSETAKRRARNRTNSGSKDTEPSGNNPSEEIPRKERRRRSTADSQTPLMNSGSSADIREIKTENHSNKTRRKKRIKSEVSPDGVDLDSTQSPR